MKILFFFQLWNTLTSFGDSLVQEGTKWNVSPCPGQPGSTSRQLSVSKIKTVSGMAVAVRRFKYGVKSAKWVRLQMFDSLINVSATMEEVNLCFPQPTLQKRNSGSERWRNMIFTFGCVTHSATFPAVENPAVPPVFAS